MFANERHSEILTLLAQKKKITVAELSQLLGVSEVTIRKDLEHLEQQNNLTRTFGGALYKEPERAGSSWFIPPESLNDYGRKQAIGILGAALVNDDDFIFLGPGYTCMEVAKNLKFKNRLAITTMNVTAAIELTNTPEFNVVMVPGDFTRRNGTYYVTGSVLIDYFSNIYFDKIFLTMDGVSLTRGFSVLDDITARIFRKLLEHTSESIVCVTSSRFGKSAMAPFGPLTIADTVITDKPVPTEYQEFFDAHNVRVIYPGCEKVI